MLFSRDVYLIVARAPANHIVGKDGIETRGKDALPGHGIIGGVTAGDRLIEVAVTVGRGKTAHIEIMGIVGDGEVSEDVFQGEAGIEGMDRLPQVLDAVGIVPVGVTPEALNHVYSAGRLREGCSQLFGEVIPEERRGVGKVHEGAIGIRQIAVHFAYIPGIAGGDVVVEGDLVFHEPGGALNGPSAPGRPVVEVDVVVLNVMEKFMGYSTANDGLGGVAKMRGIDGDPAVRGGGGVGGIEDAGVVGGIVEIGGPEAMRGPDVYVVGTDQGIPHPLGTGAREIVHRAKDVIGKVDVVVGAGGVDGHIGPVGESA